MNNETKRTKEELDIELDFAEKADSFLCYMHNYTAKDDGYGYKETNQLLGIEKADWRG